MRTLEMLDRERRIVVLSDKCTMPQLLSYVKRGSRLQKFNNSSSERTRRPYDHRSHCATSGAKYVIIISAPALLIPVNTSITMRRSSIQPCCAAALIIAYSPLTLYAAIGKL